MKDILSTVLKASDGVDSYIVGGFLRDYLLKRHSRDLDIAMPENVLKTAKKTARILKGSFVVLDKKHSIYRVVLKNHKNIDYIDFSKMKAKNILKDLSLRDFTINSIAYKITKSDNFDIKSIIDPLKGQKDIKSKTIKASSPHSFKDDPLRLIRAFRFSAELGFKIDSKTHKSIKSNHKLISKCAGERVRDELFKIFAIKNSSKYISLLEDSKIFETIFPEITLMKRSQRKFYFHPKGLWQHAFETLESLEEIYSSFSSLFSSNVKDVDLHLDEKLSSGITRRTLLKLISLLHDSAKPYCAKKINGRLRFLGHESKGALLFSAVAKRLKLSRREEKISKIIIESHMRPITLGQTKMVTLRATYRLFRDIKDDVVGLLLLSLADCYSYRRLKVKKAVSLKQQKAVVSELIKRYFEGVKKSKIPKIINGHLIMKRFKLKPGPIIGKLLDLCYEAQSMGKITTTEDAYKLIKVKLTRIKK